jgi:hypothetical protein
MGCSTAPLAWEGESEGEGPDEPFRPGAVTQYASMSRAGTSRSPA